MANSGTMESLHPLEVWIKEHSSQVQFARDVECSESFLSGVLSGSKRVSLKMAVRMSRATGGLVPVDAFDRPRAEAAQ